MRIEKKEIKFSVSIRKKKHEKLEKIKKQVEHFK